MNEALQTEKRNEAPQEKERKCCADAALPLPSLHTARPRRWAGYYTCFPRELKQVFDPIVQPHWERLRKGEIMKVFAFAPKIGFLTLKCRDGEIWVVFVNDLEYAKQLLQVLRENAAAVRHGTVLKNPQGGMWIFQPTVSILSLPLKVFSPANLLREQQLEFRRSPPWEQDREKAFKTASLEVCPRLVPSLWVSPSTLSPSAPPALPPSR